MTGVSARTMSNAATTIDVEDPARGTTIASIPKLGPEAVQRLADTARTAQPGWAATGFAGRTRVFDNARRWLLKHGDRVIRTICSETGKTYEDAQLELSAAVESFAFWAKRSEGYLSDETVPTRSLFLVGKKVVVRYEPVGLVLCLVNRW